MTDIQPIQTRYKGILFRSRTEARWAVYFDAIGVAWDYEIEGYTLASGPYLPDFWLRDIRCWAEVKGLPFSDHETALCRELSRASGAPCIQLVGPPANKPYRQIHSDSEADYGVCLTATYLDEKRFFSCGPDDDFQFADVGIAVQKASAARFEFGESGTV